MSDDRGAGLKFNHGSNEDVEGNNENKVSQQLQDLLQEHDSGDPHTLQILWDIDVWSVADLRNINADQLIHAGMKKFKVTKLKAIVDGKLANQSQSHGSGSFSGRHSQSDAKMNRGSFSFDVPAAGPPPVGRPATQNDRLTRGSFSFDVPENGPVDDRAMRTSFGSQASFGGPEAPPRKFGSHGGSQQRSPSTYSQGGNNSFNSFNNNGYPQNNRNSRDSQGGFSFGQPPGQPPMDHRFSYMSNQGPPPPPPQGQQQRMSQRSSQASFNGMSQQMSQNRSSFLGGGDSQQRGSIMSQGGGMMAGQRQSVVYENKGDPTTNKGSDATAALDSLNNMWTVLEAPDEPGPKKPIFKADPNSNPNAPGSGAPNPGGGGNGGSGLSVKMVDHHGAPSKEVIDKLEEALDGDDSEDQGVEPEDLMRLAHRLIALKQYDAALPYTLRAAKRFERRRGMHHLETMLAVMLAAKLLRRLSHFEKAIEYFALLLDIQEKILGTDHGDTANTASALGQLYAATGSPGCELDRAVTCFNQVLHIREKLVEVETSNNGGYLDHTNPTVAIHLSGCAMALHHLGVVHSDLFKYEEALGYFMRALKIRRSLGDIAEKDTASTLNNMAAVLHQLGRNEQCLAVYARSLEIKQKLLPPTHPSIADTLYNMGALNLEMDRPFEASEFFVQALTISTTKLGMHHPLTIDLQKQILTCEQLMSQQERIDANRSRDSMNGFNNMNDGFVMERYGQPPPGSNGSFSTGTHDRGSFMSYDQNFDQGPNRNGSFSNGSFSGVGGIQNNRQSGASFNNYGRGASFNGGDQYRGSFAKQSSMDSYGGGFGGQQGGQQGYYNGGQGQQQSYSQDNGGQGGYDNGQTEYPEDGAVNRKASKGSSSNDESENTVLVPPNTRDDVSPRSADGVPVRKRTGSSDSGSVDSRRSLGGEGVNVTAPPMSALNYNK